MQHFFDLQKEWRTDLNPNGVLRRRQFYQSLRRHGKIGFDAAYLMVLHQLDKVSFRYAYPFRAQLKMVSAIATTTPLGLLRYALDGSDSAIGEHTRFEAIRNFDLTRFLFDVEHEDPDEVVRSDLEEVIRLFTKHLFVAGSVDVYVKSNHNPDKHYHVCDLEFSPEPFENPINGTTQYTRLICRSVKGGDFAMLDHRPKDAWGTVFKIFSQHFRQKPEPSIVKDRRGISFIVRNEEQAYSMGMRLRQIIESEGGHIYTFTHNFNTNAPVDHTNVCSSQGFRTLKIEFRLWNSDFEIQILTVQGHLTREFATDDVNHEMYRLNQSLRYYLPLIYPFEVYGIDWEDAGVVQRLRSLVTSRLGWKLVT